MSDRLSKTELINVTMYSHRDTYSWYSSVPASVDYDRIVGLEIEAASSKETVGDASKDYTQRSYEITGAMINGLRIAMSRIALREPINCNLFSRLLNPDYVDRAISNPLGESWYPIAKYSGIGEKTEALERGEVGSVVLGSRGPVHSLVGLDEASDLSIQVMSHGAELAVLTNEELLQFYKDLNPETDVGLFVKR